MEIKSARASSASTYRAAVESLEWLTEKACGQITQKAYHDSATFSSYSKLYQLAVGVYGKYVAVRYRTLRRSPRTNWKWIDPIGTVYSNFSPP